MSKLLTGNDLIKLRKSDKKNLPSAGQKENHPSNSWLETKQIKHAVEGIFQFVGGPRIEREDALSVAIWYEDIKKAKLKTKKGKIWEYFGHSVEGVDWLYPEEALYLTEMNLLEVRLHGVALSVERCYSLLLTDCNNGNDEEGECKLSEYRVYAFLVNMGYRLVRASYNPPLDDDQDNDASEEDSCMDTEDLPQPESPDVCVVEVEHPYIVIDDDSDEESGRAVPDLGKYNDWAHSKVYMPEPLFMLPKPNKEGSHEEDDKRSIPPFLYQYSVPKILDKMPNVTDRNLRLTRPHSNCLPKGIYPRHFEYKVNLCQFSRTTFNNMYKNYMRRTTADNQPYLRPQDDRSLAIQSEAQAGVSTSQENNNIEQLLLSQLPPYFGPRGKRHRKNVRKRLKLLQQLEDTSAWFRGEKGKKVEAYVPKPLTDIQLPHSNYVPYPVNSCVPEPYIPEPVGPSLDPAPPYIPTCLKQTEKCDNALEYVPQPISKPLTDINLNESSLLEDTVAGSSINESSSKACEDSVNDSEVKPTNKSFEETNDISSSEPTKSVESLVVEVSPLPNGAASIEQSSPDPEVTNEEPLSNGPGEQAKEDPDTTTKRKFMDLTEVSSKRIKITPEDPGPSKQVVSDILGEIIEATIVEESSNDSVKLTSDQVTYCVSSQPSDNSPQVTDEDCQVIKVDKNPAKDGLIEIHDLDEDDDCRIVSVGESNDDDQQFVGRSFCRDLKNPTKTIFIDLDSSDDDEAVQLIEPATQQHSHQNNVGERGPKLPLVVDDISSDSSCLSEDGSGRSCDAQVRLGGQIVGASSWQELKQAASDAKANAIGLSAGGEIAPLVTSDSSLTYNQVLSKLQIFSSFEPPTESSCSNIEFDVYLPESYKKSDPGTPFYRVIVLEFDSDFPSTAQLERVNRIARRVPVAFAAVLPDSVNFYTFDPSSSTTQHVNH